MPNILLRDVPEEIYRELAERAEQEHRSVPGEVLHLLEQSLADREFRQARHDAAVEYLRRQFPTRRKLDVSISELIREGRDDA